MATTTTCDHCHQPVDRQQIVRIDISHPAKLRSITAGRGKQTVAERAQAAAEAAAALAVVPDHLDLHEHCYDQVIAPAIERIGG